MMDYIIEIGDRFKLGNQTIHYAVEYLDTVIHTHDVEELELDVSPVLENEPEKHYLWSIVLLMIACKFYEKDPNIPYYKEFASSSRRAKFDKSEFINTENLIMQEILDWDFSRRITPL